MKIHSLYFKDGYQGWEVSETNFGDFSLLVGVSGAGKSTVLNSILCLKSFVLDNDISPNGDEWKVGFSIGDDEYIWEGGFELSYLFLAKVAFEKIYKNGKVLLERTLENGITFNGGKTIKLPNDKSAVHLLSEEDLIKPILQAFQRIIFHDQTKSIKGDYLEMPHQVYTEYNDLESLKNSNHTTFFKLAISYQRYTKVFNKIVENLKVIFPQIENITFRVLSLVSWKNERLILELKEVNNGKWIEQESISSGMFRTLIHIADMYLQPKGSIILIDEFENSMGVNCIDIIEDLMYERDDIQYIITSHHPYVINKINYKHWKIVSRKGGTIHITDAKDLNLGKSKHQNFIQLLNLPEYKNGIA